MPDDPKETPLVGDEDLPPRPPVAHPFTADELTSYEASHADLEWDSDY